ncbi:hypothetical protein BCV70DRAFT_205080 [Testicularia cyperi]|uniref:Spindle pole body component n=1 Tax=Testicularia cyperi TaxID=1882483 RepID=A0A317XVX8_9BASI|nr:hypothetical protein BCV70DRAFT_205080 [Testicularia cyperi]
MRCLSEQAPLMLFVASSLEPIESPEILRGVRVLVTTLALGLAGAGRPNSSSVAVSHSWGVHKEEATYLFVGLVNVAMDTHAAVTTRSWQGRGARLMNLEAAVCACAAAAAAAAGKMRWVQLRHRVVAYNREMVGDAHFCSMWASYDKEREGWQFSKTTNNFMTQYCTVLLYHARGRTCACMTHHYRTHYASSLLRHSNHPACQLASLPAYQLAQLTSSPSSPSSPSSQPPRGHALAEAAGSIYVTTLHTLPLRHTRIRTSLPPRAAIMIADLLAALIGHPSSLFASSSQHGAGVSVLRVRDDLEHILHPSEIHIINHLATFSSRYTRIKRFAEDELEVARQSAIRTALRANSLARSKLPSSEADRQSSVTLHLVPLCSTLLSILRDYHRLVLQIERDVLQQDPDLVARGHFVSLANLRARLECWDVPLNALDDLVDSLIAGPKARHPTSDAATIGQAPDENASAPDALRVQPQHRVPASWTGGLLIDLLSFRASTGVGRVANHMARLRDAVEDSWMNGLVAWICRGEIYSPATLSDIETARQAPVRKDQLVRWVDFAKAGAQDGDETMDINNHIDTSIPNADGLEEWAASAASTWIFQKDALPTSISEATADSILYIGRALYTIRTSTLSRDVAAEAQARHSTAFGSHAQLPPAMTQQHQSILRRPGVRPSRPSELDRAVQSIRNDVSEWIFRNILTTRLVCQSLQNLGDYFLHRNGPFSLNLIAQVEAMRKAKLFRARSAAASMIRANDLDLALHRASVGTLAEDDPALQKLRFVLPRGSFRPSLAAGRAAKVRETSDLMTAATSAATNPSTMALPQSLTGARFDDLLIGVPAHLHYAALFPLDLFLSPTDLAAYSRIFSYLTALKKVRARVLECWVGLSKNQRTRRKFTGTGEGGIDRGEEKRRAQLLRCSWGLVRNMSWFLDTLLGHFQTDIIDAQYVLLLEQLNVASNGLTSAHPGHTGPEAGRSHVVGVATGTAARSFSMVGPRDRKHSGQRSASPVGSVVELSSRLSTIGFPSYGSSRRPAFPVSGPTTPSIASAQTGLGHRSGRRFPSASTRPESILDGVGTTIHEDGDTDGMDANDAEDGAMLDFATLRSTHSAFLVFLQDGLLLSSPDATSSIRAVLELCNRFAGLVERWGGDVLPSLLGEDDAHSAAGQQHAVVVDRQAVIDDIAADLAGKLSQFFKLLSSYSGTGLNSRTTASQSATAIGVGDASAMASQLNVSREARLDRNASKPSARKHLEQLLLRLDYSSFFSQRQQEDRQRQHERLQLGLTVA